MISIADARNRLPALVHQAEAGEAVTITRRGKPVAVVISSMVAPSGARSMAISAACLVPARGVRVECAALASPS